MKIESIKVHKIQPGETLENVLSLCVPQLAEGSVIAITSKIISITEGRCIGKDLVKKADLIKQEADYVFNAEHNSDQVCLTVKSGILMPSAGIDESNVENQYVLHPVDVWDSASRVWNYLRDSRGINNLGVIITDSCPTIMRRGVTGVALGWCGFVPLYSYIGRVDLYGRPFNMTQINVVDALASAAVFVMGEGDEQTPIAVITDAPRVEFVDRSPSLEDRKSISIDIDEDLYAPLLKSVHAI